MRKILLELFVCPRCLPREVPLRAAMVREDGQGIESAVLGCPACGGEFPVVEGTAYLLPEVRPLDTASPYAEPAVRSSYLWSQFADILGDAPNTAYTEWTHLLGRSASLALDCGCAAGRLTLAMGAFSELAIGVDRSPPLIIAARTLLRSGRLDFGLVVEGEITEPRTIVLPESVGRSRTEFIVADVLRLPFPGSTFSLLASMNVLDKVSDPLLHLLEVNRTAQTSAARLLFSDPFSWSPAVAPRERWLGGMTRGRFAGRGLDNVRRLLQGEHGLIGPPWRIETAGETDWTIRTHANHMERIRSQFLAATR
jgi:SAM-dependent methyltransferase